MREFTVELWRGRNHFALEVAPRQFYTCEIVCLVDYDRVRLRLDPTKKDPPVILRVPATEY